MDKLKELARHGLILALNIRDEQLELGDHGDYVYITMANAVIEKGKALGLIEKREGLEFVIETSES